MTDDRGDDDKRKGSKRHTTYSKIGSEEKRERKAGWERWREIKEELERSEREVREKAAIEKEYLNPHCDDCLFAFEDFFLSSKTCVKKSERE